MQTIDVERDRADSDKLVRALENGDILLFRKTPFSIPDGHRAALLNAGQADGSFHKNISYKPDGERLSGLGKAAAGEEEQVRAALRYYSDCAIALLRETLTPYSKAFKLDYASFRSIEEEGRELPWKKRNDLLHTDAFPTRPTNGGLILRIFTNINPMKERVWITGDPFARVAAEWAQAAGLARIAAVSSLKQRLLRALDSRTPYDRFMLRFHDFLKQNSEYQEHTPKYRFVFPPDSTWMVFTDVVPHSVLSGRYAVEQTVIIPRETLLQPECAPVAILEKLCGRKLTS